MKSVIYSYEKLSPVCMLIFNQDSRITNQLIKDNFKVMCVDWMSKPVLISHGYLHVTTK